ncbi:MAG: VanW family protein [Anaerolineales bacterium]|nr:VanW family protein [Anaerolineales bacterium]
MTTFVTQPTRLKRSGKSALISQIAAALIGGMALFLVGIFLVSSGYQLAYAGRMVPGVSVAGVDLSGLTVEEAAVRLSQTLTYPYSGQVLFVDGDRVWTATPAELGMVFDVGRTIQAAYDIGRSGGMFSDLAGQLNARQGGVDIQPVVMIDERVAHAYLEQIVLAINQPMLEAELQLNGTEVLYHPGQVGRVFDVDTTMTFLTIQLQSFRDGEVTMVVHEQAPQIVDASATAEALRTSLSQPLTLMIPEAAEGDPGPWTLDATTLATILRPERVPVGETGLEYQMVLNLSALQPFLDAIAAEIDRGTENARFIFDDNTRQLELVQPAVIGRNLDAEASQGAILNGLLEGEHTIPLSVVLTQPQVRNDATAESLGITERVSQQISYFRGSGLARIQNIQTASAQFHGLLIPPGATFSMAEVLGDISLDNGYAEAMIIYNGQTILGVGGGVCQVSTTLFRTAFFGGYPIHERYAHAYRVYYYEQTQYGYDANLAGLDATVYFPLVDFEFTNDTPYWLLMEVWVNVSARSITWNFYSTSDGRTVEWDTTGPQNIVPPPETEFVMNPELGADELRQVDWAAEGADVVVTRRVYRSGGLLFEDVFRTHYTPWRAVCEFGPGTDDPPSLADALGICQP